MAEVRDVLPTGAKPAVVRLEGVKQPIQTQLIDSRYVRDPMNLVLLLNDEYGNGNYEVEVRMVQWTSYLFRYLAGL